MSLRELISCIKVEKTQNNLSVPPIVCPGRHLCPPPVVFTGRHLCPPPVVCPKFTQAGRIIRMSLPELISSIEVKKNPQKKIMCLPL